MASVTSYFKSSIGRKQIVAITGLGLVLFLIAHLTGNLLLFKGPEAFNGYAEGLKKLGALLWVARLGLITLFVVHIILTITLVIENKRAKSGGYIGGAPKGPRPLSTRLMPFTGLLLFVFIIVHLMDFTFAEHHGTMSMINGADLGLYGLVVNSYTKNLFRVALYVLSMVAVGFHLTHGIQSVMQTFGFNHPVYTPIFKKTSVALGVIIAVGFSSIPLGLLLV